MGAAIYIAATSACGGASPLGLGEWGLRATAATGRPHQPPPPENANSCKNYKMISLLTYQPEAIFPPMVTPAVRHRQPASRPHFLSRAARRRCRRRSSPTCATRCSPRSSSPAISSAPRTISRPATACSRIVARDALRTLEALGIVEIKMGKGGGARIARGNPRLFAEALAVQLDLTGVDRRRDHGRAARHRVPGGRARRRERHRRRHRAAAQLIADAEAASTTPSASPQLGARIPSRGGGGLAQPRAGGAAHLAAARVVAAAQSDADAEGRAPHQRRAPRAARR